ncbi:class I SAM-dependent methyltransferase [Kineococcus gynurae]|uniref:Class I SAM-dependent methyltransferase n=1 Tax=Kineococcus gynurae TaxID=452979 RepID=A0ABV5LSC1_9ACTN
MSETDDRHPTLDRVPRLGDEVLLTAYREHVDDIARVVEQQRTRLRDHPRLRPQLDDVEAELTYALVRHLRPRRVVEVGCFWGWSTTWLLSALRDNGEGELHSFDRVGHVERTVEPELTDRWTFQLGDVRERLVEIRASDPDHVFVDAAHTRRFGRWMTSTLFPALTPGTPVSVHDVYHHRTTAPWSEGREVENWAVRSGVPILTAARPRATWLRREILELRHRAGIQGARGTTTDPMVWFDLPGRGPRREP